MATIFLHGGGDALDARDATFGRFLAALLPRPGPLALVVVEPTETAAYVSYADYLEIFTELGLPAERAIPLFAAPGAPLTRDALVQAAPAGLFVCGGVTPNYQEALCTEPAWVAELNHQDLPYCGTSAGAAIAARCAIVGGWQARRAGVIRDILYQGAGEGLDQVEVRPGLGLVPFAVDVHASQWGTLLRLIHAIDLGLVPEGRAIDESTQIECNGDQLAIHGRGQVYYVRRGAEDVTVTIQAAS